MLDEWSRESLAIEVDVSLTGERVTRALERLRPTRGLPLVIQADNGPELRGRALDQWAYEQVAQARVRAFPSVLDALLLDPAARVIERNEETCSIEHSRAGAH